MAGEYPGVDHLYKMVGNTCYHIDTEHVFDAGSDTVNIYFNIDEPTGGFYYKKPEPKTQQGGFFDLFK